MPRRDSNPQFQQASPRLWPRGHWDRHGVVSNTSAANAVHLLWLPLEPVYCLDSCTQIFRAFCVEVAVRTSDESTLAEIVQKLSPFCVFGKLTALFTAARQWSMYRVRWSQNIRELRCSGFRSFTITHFIIVFFRLFVTGSDRMEWDYATTCPVSRLPLVSPPAVLIRKSMRAVSLSVAVSFTAFVFYGNDFG